MIAPIVPIGPFSCEVTFVVPFWALTVERQQQHRREMADHDAESTDRLPIRIGR